MVNGVKPERLVHMSTKKQRQSKESFNIFDANREDWTVVNTNLQFRYEDIDTEELEKYILNVFHTEITKEEIIECFQLCDTFTSTNTTTDKWDSIYTVVITDKNRKMVNMLFRVEGIINYATKSITNKLVIRPTDIGYVTYITILNTLSLGAERV